MQQRDIPHSDDLVASTPLQPGGPTWAQAVQQMRERVAEPANAAGMFGPEWARDAQRRLLSADSDACGWADTTVLLTPTASTRLPGSDDPLPPVSHLQAIAGTRSARQSALSRALDGVRWRAVRVLGPTTDGYVTPHTGLYIGDSVGPERFDGWRQAHADNCRLPTDSWVDKAVRVEDSPEWDEHTGLARYLRSNVPGLSADGSLGLAGEADHRWRAAAVIEATNERAVRIGPTVGD